MSHFEMGRECSSSTTNALLHVPTVLGHARLSVSCHVANAHEVYSTDKTANCDGITALV